MVRTGAARVHGRTRCVVVREQVTPVRNAITPAWCAGVIGHNGGLSQHWDRRWFVSGAT